AETALFWAKNAPVRPRWPVFTPIRDLWCRPCPLRRFLTGRGDGGRSENLAVAQLAVDCKQVRLGPLAHHFAFPHLHHADGVPGDAPAGGGNAEELAGVRRPDV